MSSLLSLETLGSTIQAHIAAGDKAVGKAEEHYKSAGLHLAEAKKRVAADNTLTWPKFLTRNCCIGRRRADELIAIAEGRTSLVELRAANAASKARSRQRDRAGCPAEIPAVKLTPKTLEESQIDLFEEVSLGYASLGGHWQQMFLRENNLLRVPADDSSTLGVVDVIDDVHHDEADISEEAAAKRAISWKRKQARLKREEIQREQGAFLLSAAAARDFAFYDGIVDAKVITSCSLTIEKWTTLLAKLESNNPSAKACAAQLAAY